MAVGISLRFSGAKTGPKTVRGVCPRERAAGKARADAGLRSAVVLGLFIEEDQHFAGGEEEGPDAEVGRGFSVHDLSGDCLFADGLDVAERAVGLDGRLCEIGPAFADDGEIGGAV